MIDERQPVVAEAAEPIERQRDDPLLDSCPYLLAADGAWRATTPAAEHRCTAFAPPAPLAAEKQRRLCLTASHTSCATYLAALAARRERGLPADGESVLHRPLARTTPVVELNVGLGATVSSALTDRRGWQAIPAIVLVLALVAVGLSSFGRRDPGTAALPSASPSPTVAATATARPSPGPTGTPAPSSEATPSAPPTPTPAPTAAATPVATPTEPPASTRSYTVKSGDTLYGIAVAFNTTVKAIKDLNNLRSDIIHIGQVLKIP